MNQFYFRFRVMLMMLALGLASVSFSNWLNNYLTEIPVNLPKAESGSPIFVFPREQKLIRLGGGSGGGENCCCDPGILVPNKHKRSNISRK